MTSISNEIERNIRYQDYQVYSGISGDIKRGTTGFHKTAKERFEETVNKKPVSQYDKLKSRGVNPFESVTNPVVNEVPILPITSKNSSNQIRNYLDTLLYRMPRKRIGTDKFDPSLIPGRSVGGVNRQMQQEQNAKIAGVYTVRKMQQTPRLRPIVEPQLAR